MIPVSAMTGTDSETRRLTRRITASTSTVEARAQEKKERRGGVQSTTASALFAPASGRWGNGMPRKEGKKKKKKDQQQRSRAAQRTPRAREQGVVVPCPPLGYLLRPQFPPHLVLIARAPGVGGIESNAASARCAHRKRVSAQVRARNTERTNWARGQNGGKGADIRALGDGKRVRCVDAADCGGENKLRSHTPTACSMASLGLEDEDSAGGDMILGFGGQVKGTHIVPLCHSRAYLSSQIRPKNQGKGNSHLRRVAQHSQGVLCLWECAGQIWSPQRRCTSTYAPFLGLGKRAGRVLGTYEAIESRRFGLAAGDARPRG
ncbi:hypothetical protein C8F04DRAFT_1192960 [Mycena alexandri]|uniref:Uncharacterized protein n=1 Tax=Mycena alexandri TaxID=1745969 RepID=A0AAD6WR08_9AGAR|nr:hypothetical protein C8F04DRAFT_1192960 [Mycena alexandri]